MQKTVTLKIDEAYFDKFISFLEILPKKMVKIVNDTKTEQELEYHKKMINESLNDIKNKNTTRVKTI